MWDASKCNLCGDCLVKCLYVNYDKEKAVAEIKALMEEKRISDCDLLRGKPRRERKADAQ